MPIVVKTRPTGTSVSATECDRLLALLTAQPLVAAVCEDVSIAVGNPDDTITMTFDVAPVDAEVDAVIDAYPGLVVSKSDDYLVAEVPLDVGENLVVASTIHAAIGTQASCDPVYVTATIVAWRETAGDVKVSQPDRSGTGSITGFRVSAAGTATAARIWISPRKAGTLTIFSVETAIKSEGQL